MTTYQSIFRDERALLNGPGEALICAEDRAVDLAPASPGVSLRRRIFHPPVGCRIGDRAVLRVNFL